MKITFEIEKAKTGGYVVHQNGELVLATSTLPELYAELGTMLRTEYKEGVRAPHAVVTRDEAKEPEQVQARPSRKPPEVPEKPSSYTVPNPRPNGVADLMREQQERLNGHTTGMVDRVPAVG